MQAKRPGDVDAFGREHVFLDQIVDRDRALMLDIRSRPPDRLVVERHRDDPIVLIIAGRGLAHDRLRRSPIEREWASSPSAFPRIIAAGPSARNWSGPHLRIEVRFMKSSTPSPDENRAERAVGRTWLEPPT